MATLRLFANLREIAGTSSIDVPGDTVGEVIAAAVAKFGDDFAAALGPARVWVDGEQAHEDTPVTEESEVALIPPVSGGATVVRNPAGLEIGLVAILAGGLFAANAADLKWFAVAVVLVGAVWAMDITRAATERGVAVSAIPVLAAVLGGVLGTYRFGGAGLAVASTGAALVALLWSVFVPSLRPITSVAGSVAVSLVAAFGSSAMIMLRLRSSDETLAFLFTVVVAVVLSWLASATDALPLDPLASLMLGAIAGGALGGALWAPDFVPVIAGAVAASIALVAGRNLGTLMRAGGFWAGGSMPGSLHYFDGIIMAAGPFWWMVTLLD
jgi:molybdopterin converting factor small subunit